MAVLNEIAFHIERPKFAPVADHRSVLRAFEVECVDRLEVIQIPDRSEIDPLPATPEPSLNVPGKRFPSASQELEERLGMEDPGVPTAFLPGDFKPMCWVRLETSPGSILAGVRLRLPGSLRDNVLLGQAEIPYSVDTSGGRPAGSIRDIWLGPHMARR
jgi:hypothetical protein